VSPDLIRFESLGTTCELLAVGIELDRLAEGQAWIESMHCRLTRFEASSELSCFNASAGEWVAVSPELEALLREALRAHGVSGGLVHAAVLRALVAAGYGRTFAAGPTAVLDTVSLGALPPLPELLEVTAGGARLRSGFGIDLGGIAKGWLADRLAERLGENCVVNLGGDLYARGIGPDGEGWPIGFGGTTIYLRDQGAATSGTTKRRWGPDLHHLVDPRTGRPAKSNLKEVSVIASSGTDAEIYAKTALLLGRQSAEFYLEQHSPGWWLSP
jgi:thiamine biosynthesis lipoprotein